MGLEVSLLPMRGHATRSVGPLRAESTPSGRKHRTPGPHQQDENTTNAHGSWGSGPCAPERTQIGQHPDCSLFETPSRGPGRLQPDSRPLESVS